MNRLFNRSKDTPQLLIMVIEDDVPIADLITELLKEEGYAVLTANSAEQALSLLDEAAPPQLFVVDFTLPDMDGSQFIERVRNWFGRSNMPPIMMLTASIDGEARANALQVDDYLPKPFKNQTLVDHVASLFSNEHSQSGKNT